MGNQEEKDKTVVAVYKAKLKRPNEEQEAVLRKHCEISMRAKNWYVRRLLDLLKEDGVLITEPWDNINKKYCPAVIAKLFRDEKKENPELAWAYEVTSSVCNNAINKDNDNNWKRKFYGGLKLAQEFVESKGTDYYCYPKKGKKVPEYKLDDFYHIKGFPNWKSFDRDLSFCVEGCSVVNNTIFVPKSNGYKKFNVPMTKASSFSFWSKDTDIDESYINSHNTYTTFSFDGKDWWVSITVDVNSLPHREVKPFTGEKYSVGIDKGIKTTLVFSDGIVVNSPYWTDEILLNLFKKEKVIDTKMKKNLLNKRVGNAIKLENPKNTRGEYWEKVKKYKDYKLKHDKHMQDYDREAKVEYSCRYKNLKKQQDRIRVAIKRRKKWLIDNAIAQIPFERYSRIVVEKFSIAFWFKNHKWASKLQKTGAGTLMATIRRTAKRYGIEWVDVKQDIHMASTKTCSNCGEKQDMDLSKRTYRCPHCGMVMDRDLNAAVNLAKYVPPKKDKKKVDKK